MLTDLYISYTDFLNKRSVFEKLFYISLILIILYCVLIYRSTVETMENRASIGQFVTVYGNNIYDNYYVDIYDELFLNKTKNDYEIDLIIKKTIQENLVSKHLIKELIKEVERLTLTNKIFKNKIIENETRSFKNKIFEIDYIEINKTVLIGFLLVMFFASYGFSIFIVAAYKKITFKLAN